MKEHVFLVAVQVSLPDYMNRLDAEREMRAMLPRPGEYLKTAGQVECWWVAEDDRDDGSDNDSAIFVTPGAAQVAYEVLHKAGLTPDCNDPSKTQGDTFWEAPEYRTDTTYTEDQLLDMLAEGGPFPEGTRFMVLPPIEE